MDRAIERFSQFMYRKFYNRYKYKKLIELSWVKACIYPLYSLFNFFYFHRVLKFYQKQIERVGDTTQIVVMGRKDFGTHLYGLHYLRLWEKARGKACLFVFTMENSHIKKLAKVMVPEVEVLFPDTFWDHLVLIIFGHQLVFKYTWLPVYAQIATSRPDLLHMFDLADTPYARYNAFLDPYLDLPSCQNFSKEFLHAYRELRIKYDYRWEVFQDGCLLNYSTPLQKINVTSFITSLQKQLNITHPYVVMNINAKRYQGVSGRRDIRYPERYNCLIDDLIEKGYQVVLQGRKEQPCFKPRKGFIDYSKSDFCTIENDLALYANAAFAVSSKSGVEIFATLCDIPILGLNYTELLGLQPSKKMRFYPKFVKDTNQNKILSWKEHVTSPYFFEIGMHCFGKAEYIDMTEEEMLEALNEFYPLVSASHNWEEYSPLQKEFKQTLTPLHLELYLSKGVPCDAYLRK